LILVEDFAPWQDMYNYLQISLALLNGFASIDKEDLKDLNLPWKVKIETADGDNQTLEFDFVVVATGLFSTPYKPTFSGQDKFIGSIVHTSDIKTPDQLIDKRVIVIGNGKSAPLRQLLYMVNYII
jgi:thioredoxin reductase